MKLILRQAAFTLLACVTLYAVILAVTLLIAPDREQLGFIDAWGKAGSTVYMTSPKYAFLRRDILDVPDRKVIMFGASNTGFGLRPDAIQPGVSCAKVSSLAIGSANITEVSQLIDLLLDVQDAAAQRTDTFVIGVWFGMFLDTERLWPGPDRHHGDTDVDIERYRYGFYRRTDHGPVAMLPPRFLHAEVTLIRPWLLLEQTARWLTASVRSKLNPHNLTDREREARIFSSAQRADALAYWHNIFGAGGEIAPAQVELLRHTIEHLLDIGARVVLVDLPLPAWFHDNSPWEAGYIRMVEGPVFAQFAGRPNFAAVKMLDLNGDSDYSDEVHPKPHLANVWAQRLISVLDPLVCGKPMSVAGVTPGDAADASAARTAAGGNSNP